MFVDIAYQCLRRERTERPLMRQVVGTLEWSLALQEWEDAKQAVRRDGILTVKVLSITDLNNNPFDASKQYLVFNISIGVYIQRKAKYYEANAKCNEEFTLYVNHLLENDLEIYVNNIVSVNKHCHLGKTCMKLIDLTPEIPCTRKLPLFDVNDRKIGNLIVEVSYKPNNIEDVISFVLKAPIGTPKDGGLLVIIIHGANVHQTKGPSSVSLIFRGEVRKTKSMMNTYTPVWIQEFTFMLEQPPTDENVQFEVINDESMEPIGWVDVSLASVVNRKLTDGYYSLEPTYHVGEIAITNLLHVEMHWRTSN
ncbi:putative C2 domain-containing protein [Helianthus debilis subsp. tardiflorus]